MVDFPVAERCVCGGGERRGEGDCVVILFFRLHDCNNFFLSSLEVGTIFFKLMMMTMVKRGNKLMVRHLVFLYTSKSTRRNYSGLCNNVEDIIKQLRLIFSPNLFLWARGSSLT